MSQTISDRILAEYDNIRSKEEMLKIQRIEKFHLQVPRLAEIRNEIASLGHKYAIELSKNPQDEDNIRIKLNSETDKLKKEKLKLLKENNIPEDYDKTRYHCSICQDTGYVENERCKCYKAKLTEYAYERSNLSNHMKEISFDKFNFKYFSDVADKDGVSALQRIQKAHSEAMKMVDDFDNYEKSFLYFGTPGSGKTFLCGCIATSLIEKGYNVLYITASKLFELMENKKYNRQRDTADDELIDTAYSCDLLILDDLGTEFPSKLRPSFAYDILNERLLAGKKIILSTGLSVDGLSNEYGQRFVSRLFEHFYALRFSADDIRKQKMYE